MNVNDIEEAVGKGEFEVEFKKVNGSLRSFKCHCGAAKVFRDNTKGGKAAYDFSKKKLLPVYVDGEWNSDGKSGFRSVRLGTITRVVIDGVDYRVDEDGELQESV